MLLVAAVAVCAAATGPLYLRAGQQSLLREELTDAPPDATGLSVVKAATGAGSLDRLMRARSLGVVFPSPGRNVLGHACALDNLLFAQRAGGRSRAHRRQQATELLVRVGLAGKADTRAGSLSGGEQQRFAVAVGLADDPALLLARPRRAGAAGLRARIPADRAGERRAPADGPRTAPRRGRGTHR